MPEIIPENIMFDITITIIDKDSDEKAGQLRYQIKESEIEIFDTYLFKEYRKKKIISNLLEKMKPKLKEFGISKIKLKQFDEDARIAWEKMGFKSVDDKGGMELDID